MVSSTTTAEITISNPPRAPLISPFASALLVTTSESMYFTPAMMIFITARRAAILIDKMYRALMYCPISVLLAVTRGIFTSVSNIGRDCAKTVAGIAASKNVKTERIL